MNRRGILKLCLLLVLGVSIGTLIHPVIQNVLNKNAGSITAGIYDLQDKLTTIGQLATPAVVGISTTTIIRQRGVTDPYQQDLFWFFFGLPEREFKQNGIGSGFIVDPKGYILTNQHVVDKAQDITVVLQNGSKYKAQVTGYDTRSDLALLKIDATNLPYLELGDSDKVKPGQWAIAIGNPFTIFEDNPTASMTLGIVSAIHRQLPSSDMQNRYYGDLIQTDASINPGNSGGPLVDIDGNVIGINVAIISRSGESAGMGFALPVNRAKRVLNNLIEGKEIQYGWLGVAIQPLSPDLLQSLGLNKRIGVLVAEVLEGAPAAQAGIQRRDIITKFADKEVKSAEDLIAMVNETEIGETVNLEVIRNGSRHVIPVTIAARKSNLASQQPNSQEYIVWRGLTLQNINDQILRNYGLEAMEGVIVINVDPNSPAEQSGIKPGDVIDEVNRQAVRSIKEFTSITENAKGNILIHSYNQGYVVVSE
ncbi:MAG: Do family serine endopeptidase [Candidatus Auribacter fodinae]|jgi:serine protease Do|uniref:Do family serine endopeptidase n=1 Tax=Candidatus Auribacter fodinae TaxID=2093366 RepID=A0A3A4QY81_9BACT|nr:MAG: Do family serine endopeptidase [Candidatus Auribacter fodinae]